MTADDGLRPRPPRDERMQAYVSNSLTMQVLLTLNSPGYAGNDPNPRPMTNVDLGQSAEISDRVTAPMRREIPDSAVFPIWSTRRRVPLDRGVAVPPEHLWWFAEPGDVALLSDRQTHHFCMISHVDADTQTIAFADPWPDQFFLQAGRNTLGIAANGTQISRADFARVAVGIERWDRLTLFDAYLQAFPAQAATAEMRCRLGHSVLNIGSDRLLPAAAEHFGRARDLARAVGDEALALHAAARLWLVGTAGHAVYAAAGVPPVAAALAALAGDAQRQYAPRTLIEQLRPAELCRLAFCAGHIGRHDLAEAAAARAIEVEPAFEDGWWQRASARFSQGRAAEALQDVDRYLELNDRSLPAARLRQQGLHPLDSVAASQLGAEIGEREQRRTGVLELAVSAAAALQDAPRAISYLRLLHALHPERDDVVQRLRLLGS
jgi:tetratricopeptide (TPR) repeat protein